MKILFDINHPAHVHLLRNVYHELIKRGHKIWVTVKDIPIAKDLLNYYSINYIDIGKKRDSLKGKAITQFEYNYKIFRLVIKNKIEIGIGTSITIAHISKVTKMRSIILDDDDDEIEPLFVKYAHPFADTILSPEALLGYRKNNKTLFYKGFHELAYLYPNRFKPDKKVLRELGLKGTDSFFIMRFNVFKAHHDVGVNGLNIEQKLKLIDLLKPHGKIFITTEREIEPELKKYQLPVSPEKIHSLMSFATMFLGDSQTMTSEAAVLGVPSIRCNDFVGRISYLEEEENNYGLTFGYKPAEFDKMLLKVDELLNISNLREEWQKRRLKMLKDKIDVTAFLVWFVENYPESVKIIKKTPDYQLKFK